MHLNPRKELPACSSFPDPTEVVITLSVGVTLSYRSLCEKVKNYYGVKFDHSARSILLPLPLSSHWPIQGINKQNKSNSYPFKGLILLLTMKGMPSMTFTL